MRSKRLRHLFLACAAACASASGAGAGVAFDLRATSVNGAGLSGSQSPHAITNVLVGDVIAFDVFAVITGTDANFSNDVFISGIGSFRSTPPQFPTPNLRGTLKMDVVRTALDPDTGDPVGPLGFDAIGYSIGMQQDLDGDGDLDVGSNFVPLPDDYWAVRYFSAPIGAPAGLPNGKKLGFGTFTVTSVPAGSETLVQFGGRNISVGSTYLQDGVIMQLPSFDSTPEQSIRVSTVPIPEPASAALLGSVCLALRSRRRRI
jgi:hypothetical protein